MIRIILPGILLAWPLLAVAGQDAVIRLSEPVQQNADYEVFGEPMAGGEAAIPLAALLAQVDSRLGRPATVTLRVSKVCRKKGCFFLAQAGDQLVRVSFSDYGFFVPTDIDGRDVTLTGVLRRAEVSDEQVRHARSDLGDPAPGPGWDYEIVATSVQVPRETR